MAQSKKTVNRTMFLLARYTWKDGSRVVLKIRSVKEDGKSDDYTVIIYNNGCMDNCNCLGYGFTHHCCHMDHFKAIEQFRKEAKQIASARHLDAVVVKVNAECGAQVVRRGVAPAAPKEVVQQYDRSTAPLQRGIFLLPKSYAQMEEERAAKKGVA